MLRLSNGSYMLRLSIGSCMLRVGLRLKLRLSFRGSGGHEPMLSLSILVLEPNHPD